MKTEQAYKLIYEYLSGDLDPAVRSEFEQILRADDRLRLAVEQSRRMESLLQSQPVLTPSYGFTASVLMRAGLIKRPVEITEPSRWERALDWIQGLAPAATLATVVALYGKRFGLQLLGLYEESAIWVGSQTGMSLFTDHPLFLLGGIVPIVAIGIFIIGYGNTWRVNN
jgi:hypothetical protein